MAAVAEKEWQLTLPLLRFQFGAMAVWLVGLQFWATYAAVASCKEPRSLAWFFSWKFFVLLRLTAKIAIASLASTVLRHRHTWVKNRVFSRVVVLLRSLFVYILCHAAHGLCGWWIASAFESVVENEGAHSVVSVEEQAHIAKTAGFASGIGFSFLFFCCGRNVVSFPVIQSRRITRVRKGLGSLLVRSSTQSLFTVALLFVLSLNGFIPIGDNNMRQSFAQLAVCSWVVYFSLDLGAVLYSIFMSENKPLSMSTQHAISDDEEVELLCKVISQNEQGSLEEALLSFPLKFLASQDDYKSFKGRSSMSFSESSLMTFAKASEMKMLKRKKLALDVSHHEFQDQDIQINEEAVKELQIWWIQTCESKLAQSSMKDSWEVLCELRQRKIEAVTQAIYSADSISPGYAFAKRSKLSPSHEIARARAFQDLASLSEFSETRRRNIFNNKRSWFEVFESCTAVLDAFSISLRVATRNSAIDPTVPIAANGTSLMDVFVLGPKPDEMETVDSQRRRELAWQAEFAARMLRRCSWVSLEWWSNAFLSQFSEYDPLATQFSFELAEKGIRDSSSSKSSAEKSQSGHNSAAGSSSSAWKQQWERQQSNRSRKWIASFLGYLSRTPSEQSLALFSDCEVVCWAALALGNLVSHSIVEDQYGNVPVTIPAILESLLTCLTAVEDYVKCPVFLGSVDPPPELEGNQLTRMEARRVNFTLERTIFAVTSTFRDRLRGFQFAPRQAQLLSRFINFEI